MRIRTSAAVALALAGGLCTAISPFAQAAGTESVDLTITGTISLGACIPVFDNGGTVDYGKISSAALTTGAPTDLGPKSTNLTVTCDAPRSVGLTITDNAAASVVPTALGAVPAGKGFGLGQTAGNVNLGAYSIGVKSVTLDGTAGDVITSADNTTWTAAPTDGLASNAAGTTWSAATAGTDTATAPATTFVYGIDVNAALQDAATLAISAETPLAGSATFTLVYL
jgi:hypothetical protein